MGHQLPQRLCPVRRRRRSQSGAAQPRTAPALYCGRRVIFTRDPNRGARLQTAQAVLRGRSWIGSAEARPTRRGACERIAAGADVVCTTQSCLLPRQVKHSQIPLYPCQVLAKRPAALDVERELRHARQSLQVEIDSQVCIAGIVPVPTTTGATLGQSKKVGDIGALKGDSRLCQSRPQAAPGSRRRLLPQPPAL